MTCRLFKTLCIVLFLINVLNANSAESKKPIEFPESYFKNQQSTDAEKTKDPEDIVPSGKDDQFLNYDEYSKVRSKIEKGNASNVKKCNCIGSNCSYCHININRQYGGDINANVSNFRVLPIPDITDKQINPYFMTLSRQRLMTNTGNDEAFTMPKEPSIISEIEKQESLAKKSGVLNKSNKTWRGYKFISIGRGIAGSGARFTSKESGYLDKSSNFSGTLPSETTNFEFEKRGMAGSHFSFGGGVERDLAKFLGVRVELDVSVGNLSGSGKKTSEPGIDITEASGVTTNADRTFNVSNSYGDMRYYSVGGTVFFDLMKNGSFIYPSIGGGVVGRYIDFQGNPNAKGLIMMSSIAGQLNIPIDANSTLFVGVKYLRPFESISTFKNNSTDIVTNSDSSSIDDKVEYQRKDDRYINKREIEMKDFSTIVFDIGIRF